VVTEKSYNNPINYANLKNSEIMHADLENSDFSKAYVDGSTTIDHCNVYRNTDFRFIGLGSIRIDPATRQLLEYNIRRENWEKWYTKRRILKWPVKFFWFLSDYGKSTPRVISCFLGLSLLFALFYFFWSYFFPPGIIQNLYCYEYNPQLSLLSFIRSCYFSVVTMTTLGFGDMYAVPDS